MFCATSREDQAQGRPSYQLSASLLLRRYHKRCPFVSTWSPSSAEAIHSPFPPSFAGHNKDVVGPCPQASNGKLSRTAGRLFSIPTAVLGSLESGTTVKWLVCLPEQYRQNQRSLILLFKILSRLR